ncbi:ABC transporter ATP-binding protein [Deltaproteobacteria bacterium TL4]
MSFQDKKGLHLQDVSKSFDEVVAVRNVSIDVEAGTFFTLLGPSGCGKTTLLRIIAGLALPDSGRVILGGKDITSLPATKRQVNTVFQSYALFPHLSIYDNIAFGLRSRKFAEEDIKKRITPHIEMLDIGKLITRKPDQISGGQKQRVALARALVNEPEVLLLDEPMSALDAKLRAQLQVELRQLQQRLKQTFILVTHDQEEALIVSDTIAVMRDGGIVQYGAPEEVYDKPNSQFVAEFLGAANLLEGVFDNHYFETEMGRFELENPPLWKQGKVAIRPEWISVHEQQPAKNGVWAEVSKIIYRGSDFDIWFAPGPLRVRSSSYKHFKIGDRAWLNLAPSDLVALNE